MHYNACRSCRVMPREAVRKSAPVSSGCGCSDRVDNTGIYTHADHLPLTMAYVPCQQFSTVCENTALRKELLKEYAARFGPLTLDSDSENCRQCWDWVMQPWPWEGVC